MLNASVYAKWHVDSVIFIFAFSLYCIGYARRVIGETVLSAHPLRRSLPHKSRHVQACLGQGHLKVSVVFVLCGNS